MKIILSLFIFTVALFANIGTVTLLKGEATIKHGNGVVDVKMGDDVNSGDQIDTYAKSKMQIILSDNTIITLGANTKYIIDSYDDKNDLHASMRLKRGLLKIITGKIGKIAPSRFKLKTKSATIGVRGTGWRTYVGANVENFVCFKGAIVIALDKKTILLPAGNMLLITDHVAKKVKMNMKFFNAQIKKIELKQKYKQKVKAQLPAKNNDEVDKESKGAEHSDITVKNIPPEYELEIKPNTEINTNIIKDSIDEINQDVKVEVVNEAIDKNNEEAFKIILIVEIPENNPDPSTGP